MAPKHGSFSLALLSEILGEPPQDWLYLSEVVGAESACVGHI